jgi:lactonase
MRFFSTFRQATLLAAVGLGCFTTTSCVAASTVKSDSAGALDEPVPIPPSERSLPAVIAEPYFKVSNEGLNLEGTSFDLRGNLLFVEVFGGRVFSLSPSRKLTTLVAPNKYGSAGLAIHKDGRLFVAGLGNFQDTGSLVTFSPDGRELQTVISADKGFLVDDLVFDANGGFYFTDFRGSTTEPTGGVYYVSPDLKTVTPILPHLAAANGVALSPDGKTLWITEFSKGLLHRVQLSDATTVAPFGTAITYQFTGPSPDSMRVDSAGNLYVAIYSQGRVLIFNKMGIPIRQILIPGRQQGHNLLSTSMAIKPGTDELYIVANDAKGGRGATVFRTKALAKAVLLYSHQ